MDYEGLIGAALSLSREEEEGWKAYRLMVFNVLAANTDDHAKDFSFLYDEEKGRYVLSPAYDLTNPHPGKGHSLLVNHEFRPEKEDLLLVAKHFAMDKSKAESIIEKTLEAVTRRLGRYLK